MRCVQVKPLHHAFNRPPPSVSPRRPHAIAANTGFNLPKYEAILAKNETNLARNQAIPDKNEATFVKNDAGFPKTDVILAGTQANIAATEANDARIAASLAGKETNDVCIRLTLCKRAPLPSVLTTIPPCTTSMP
ncbi:MAG: hypothetical protein AAF561_03370 [Planctomycetota bacterium]